MVGDKDLVTEMFDTIAQLDAMIETLKRYGAAYAEAERAYKIRLSETAIRLKADGMAVTLIDKVIYGNREVAQLRFERDSKEVLYNAALEQINVTKLKLRLLEGQVQREWGGNKYD